MTERSWDVQWCANPWLSLGVHLDHADPSLTLHLPGVIVSFGRLKQPGFRPVPRDDLAERRPHIVIDATRHGGGAYVIPVAYFEAFLRGEDVECLELPAARALVADWLKETQSAMLEGYPDD